MGDGDVRKGTLLFQAGIKILMGLLLMGLLLFWPAGTLHYWNGWLLIGLLFVPMAIVGVVLLRKSPQLLAKRLNGREKERTQRWVILFSLFLFIGGFLVAALDFRYGWSCLPAWVVWAAAIVFLISYGLYAEVMRENAYLSRAVEIQSDQKVIDTGLYGMVRHPMYFATVLLFCSMPLILGSLYAFAIFLLFPVLLVARIKNEEAVLKAGLNGYEAYMQKVRYRLVPFIW